VGPKKLRAEFAEMASLLAERYVAGINNRYKQRPKEK
jgi:hypothetical protein